MYLEYYLKQLNYEIIPPFLDKYLSTPSLIRLKKISFFCGMDYASKKIYNFREYISRFDHSLTVALITYKLTNDKTATLAGLLHDISTPCFSHVIDYMNKDYIKQESTEKHTEKIIKKDKYLMKCLKEDNIKVKDVANFKKHTIVDNERPKLCADRIDGIILAGISWTKNLSKDEIKNIVSDLTVFKNEDKEDEIGFKMTKTAEKVVKINRILDEYCKSKEDTYMMQLLADITQKAIDKGYIKYDDLYVYNEEYLLSLLKIQNDKEINDLFKKFQTISKKKIPNIELPEVKTRHLNPLVNNKRFDTLFTETFLKKLSQPLNKKNAE